MNPIDDNETPDDIEDEIDEIVEDVEKEDFDINIEIKRKRKSRGVRRTTGKEYGTMLSFIAWIAFTIIWLFFFAGNFELFGNLAVVFVALLIVGAANTLVWIPRHEGRRTTASAISGIGWLVFLILWIVFGASYFGFYENLGIGLASLLVVGLVNMLLHVPSHGDEGGARISGFGAIVWLTFLVLWLPFANDFSDVFATTGNQNAAILVASFLLMTIVVIAPWFGKMQVAINKEVATGGRPKGSIGLFWAWLAVLVVWFWAFADVADSVNKNLAVILLTLAVFCAILFAMWLPWARKRGEGPESWLSIGLAFIWITVLGIWFWIAADVFTPYQNFAVFLVSLLVIGGIAVGSQWKKYRDFEAMDWKD